LKKMLIAGDIGGTKTLLGAFDPLPTRPRPIAVGAFATVEHADLSAMIAEFLRVNSLGDQPIESACFGVAGPVIGDSATLTNVPWRIDARRVGERLHVSRVTLLNDLEAMAHGVTSLHESELHTLQAGEALRGGNIALIAAGTGLGEALLHNVQGRFIPSASEGGHADFAARNEREMALARVLIAEHGRVEVERVLSGPGLVNIHRATHGIGSCTGVRDVTDPDAPAAISTAALERRCPACVEALEMFVDVYGAEAGNLALRSVATGGVYVGGGIAPKILLALSDGRFMRAFRQKPPLDRLLGAMPVKVILNPETGLLGAAVYAASLMRT
jgi:glucokinase